MSKRNVWQKFFLIMTMKGLLKWMPDKVYLMFMYWAMTGKRLNLKDPKTFNEKMQWMKLYDRNPQYTSMVDKYEVKKIVADTIGEEYVIPSLGGPWDNFDEIDFEMLPDQFVLKTTHDCGGVIVCKDKMVFDKEQARNKIEKHLRRNYYSWCREWPYKEIKPRVFAEKFMQDGNNDFLPVYKFFCFNGEPKIIQSIQNDKQEDESIDYFDVNWNRIDMRQNFPNSEKPLPKPGCLKQMVELARKLSSCKKNFIRVDLYEINGKIYFSEYTFFSDAGFAPFDPEDWDNKLGELVRLSINE